MPIERPLLDILACPIDKQGLLYFEDEAILYNPRLRRIYRLADDHLIMLADRAEPAPAQEHERLLKRARHGDAVGTGGSRAGLLAAEDADAPAGPGTSRGDGQRPA
jgi:uncharacterized protein